MNAFAKLLPVIVIALAGGWLLSKAVPPSDALTGMQVQQFAQLPLVYQGRIKPFDTLARNSLTIISDRQSWVDDNGKRQPAITWLLNVITQAPESRSAKVFRVENPQILEVMGLEQREGFRYSIDEFAPKIDELDKQANRARALEPGQRDAFDVHVLEFAEQVRLYTLLVEAFRLIPQPAVGQGMQAAMMHIQQLENMPLPLAIAPDTAEGKWKPLISAYFQTHQTTNPDRTTLAFTEILAGWVNKDPGAFNAALGKYQAMMRIKLPHWQIEKLGFETFFNHFEPFYHCAVLYVFAFLLACFAWLGFTHPLNRAAFWLIAVTLAVHTFALGARIYISGYPPVTNLYSSAIFIGWGCVILGLIVEWKFPIGVGNLVAAVLGFLTLLIAHFLAGDGDTMEMMQAVLDTKFWLATHVTTVTLGYTATYFAGFLAMIYILRGVLTRSLDKPTEKMFGRMIYGVICFALLLSFVGTVLGGLWADDSWGRFWGWDPKENGALIIVLWNALVLHARWGGMIKVRGVAVLALFGNIVTSWSWFGVNQLGIGLHSYGFISTVAFWLTLFVLSQVVLIIVGMLPRNLWASSGNFEPRDPRSTPDALPAT